MNSHNPLQEEKKKRERKGTGGIKRERERFSAP
jgi:hypothetical protein